MAPRNPFYAFLVALVLLMPAPALAASHSSSATKTAASSNALLRPASSNALLTPASRNALLKSAQLWATIDVCSPADQPDKVGVRGSMPGDGHSGDVMYMRFRLQYLETATKRWVDLRNGETPGFSAVGGAKSARQGGTSFQLVPVPGKPAFTLRGVVSFQWRRGATVLESLSRPTTQGHQSVAGADPASFSAATCSIG